MPIVGGYTLQSINAIINNEPTRTYAVQGADGSIQMLWHADDQIAVSDLTSCAKYNLDSGADSTEATFTVDDSSSSVTFVENAPLYAIAPYDRVVFSNDGGFRANIPAAQYHTGVDSDNDVLRNVMLGTTTDGGATFDFTLAAALARFSVTVAEGETIKSVKMITESVGLAGTTTVDWQNKRLNSLTQEGSNDSDFVGSIESLDTSYILWDDDSSSEYGDMGGVTKYVTLIYNNTPASPYSDGYALIAPVDLSAAEGKILYEVTTDNGVYTFCKKPKKKFEAGYIYNFPLDITKFSKADSYETLADGEYFFETLHVASVRRTDSTITIGWSNSASNKSRLSTILPASSGDYFAGDIDKTYKVALYSDAACSNLVVSVDNIVASSLYNANLLPPRFVFPGLTPSTTYYAKVWNTTDGTVSRALEVSTTASAADRSNVVTSNAKAGDLILFENFEGLIYGGELSSRGAGISRTDRSSLTDIAPVTGAIIAGSDNYYMVGGGTEMGLFNTLKGVLDEIGVAEWGYIGGVDGSICARPGYLKIGTGSNRSFVCTPALTAIPEGKAATVTVQFKAAPYGDAGKSTITEDEKKLAVKAISNVTFTDLEKSVNRVSYTVEDDAVYLTLSGDDITDWEDCEVTLENLPSGGVVAIGGGQDSETTTNRFQLDDIRITVTEIYDYVAPPGRAAVSGTITYSDGTAAAGVSVSDGYTVVQTDADGKYTIQNPHKDAWYIYYSTPADCEVSINGYGQPCFFTKYDENVPTYDFTLTKLAGGKETDFTLFCLADPQCHGAIRYDSASSQVKADTYRFNNESVPAIKAHVATKTAPCYGVTLGDIVYSEGNRNSTSYMDDMRSYMAKENIGMPIFQTMGNHDYTYFKSSSPIEADETSSTFNIKAQRAFEDCFGPINHSWNRGDAHIICMRNMQWNSNTSASDYTSPTFTSDQVEWLKQDLSFVPTDKLVIFCVHVPLVNSSKAGVQDVISLLKKYSNCHIMSGHTHYMRNEPTKSGGIYEHVHAAVSGQWWWSNINGDGCPNGYGVYDISGNTITNWYYMGINEGMDDRDYQIRLYRGDLICGGTRTYFELQHGNNVIIANVFNADKNWTVKIYEDDKSYDMIAIGEKKYSSKEGSTYYIAPGGWYETVEVPTDSGQDWWAIGYHIGVIGRSGTNGSYHTNCFHMYKHELVNPNATIRVEATDIFGRTYTATEIVSNTASGTYNSDIYTGVPWNY